MNRPTLFCPGSLRPGAYGVEAMTFTTPADICPASGGECSVTLTLGFAHGVVEFLRAVVTDPGTSAYAAGDECPTDTLNDACGDWAAWCGDQA